MSQRRIAGSGPRRGAPVRAVAGVLALAAAWLPAGAARVSLPTDAVTDPGQQVEVYLSIEPVDGMLAADIDIAYDPRYLRAISVEKTSLVEGFTLTSNVSRPGWIYISLFSTSTTTGSGPVLEITLEAQQPGCSRLDITRVLLNEGELPAELEDGNLAIRDPIDRDGDGWTEAAGDCSDRFDWIHPGAVELCNGVDDDCDGSDDGPGLCVCPRFPAPRTADFWTSACRGTNLEAQVEASFVDQVNDAATFAAVATTADICAVLTTAAHDPCALAEREFMALLLNLASARLCREQPISGSASGEPDVGGAADLVDGLLASPGRTAGDCAEADGIAEEIDSGQVVPHFLSEEIDVRVSRPGGSDVVLSWEAPDAAAAGRPTVYRVHRSADLPPSWSLRGVTRCTLWFPDWGVTVEPGAARHYQVSGAVP